jgi:hypothetical protein
MFGRREGTPLALAGEDTGVSETSWMGRRLDLSAEQRSKVSRAEHEVLEALDNGDRECRVTQGYHIY